MGANFYDFTYEELQDLGYNVLPPDDALLPGHKFDFSYIVKSRQFSNYLDIGEEQMQEVDRWCKDNLTGYFKIDPDRSSFEYEDDAFAFKLTWTE